VNDAKPVTTEEMAKWLYGGPYSPGLPDARLEATCRQRDELVAALQAIQTELERPGELMGGVLRACSEACSVLKKWGGK
jgi:hypothetical protein